MRAFPQVLRDGLRLAHQRLNLVLIDVLWRGIWLGATLILIAIFVGWFGLQLSSLEWQGPDLAVSQPIILLYAVQQIWTAYSRAFVFGAAGVVALAIVLWLLLEAYFRGGRGNFWIFIGSSLARLAILLTAAILLGLISYRDGSSGMLFIAAVVFLGLGVVVTVAETLIRQDAIDLWATHFLHVFGAIGISLMIEVVSLMVVAVMSAALIVASSRLAELAIALGVSTLALAIWSVFQSYLLVVRFSTVDIMRPNVGENVRDI